MKQTIIVLASLAALVLTACGSTSGLSKAEQEALIAQQVEAALEATHYTIAVDWMKPLGGMARHVTSEYELKINGDQVDSYLPYVGEAYRLPYGGGKGLNFKAKMMNYRITRTTHNRYVVEFDVNNEEDVYHYRIDLFSNGRAIIDVIGQDRDAISFDGELIL